MIHIRPPARLRRWAAPLGVAAALALYAVLVPLGWAYADTGPYWRSAADVPAAPVALVLGAGIVKGEPSGLLARRLDLAADLYRRGKVRVLLVSGDNRTKDYDEPTVMRDYLVAHGIPAAKIVRDFAGLDTWDSCARARRIFGVRELTVVTQDFHLPRAVALCRAAGITAWGVGDDSLDGRTQPTLAGYAREPLAMLKATGSLVLRPDPRVLGAPETSVRRALAAP
ncbi:SanA/YdcF family protein [Actinomadura parmotrematis]|uniref:YdcF family protein n=1 Tax=Actinomadura parmotrematis TaxID=2864039 RepID=A0ABS7FPD2_9ACTN|nr:ElyC/SanA/YdcF family protein [Actinomadura parmotrematis]MBW8482080.1 YdcF family protein [Actinomadura parmotrematis]